MLKGPFKQLGLALLLVSCPLLAQEENACSLPGILVSEDPAGDHSLAPTGEGFADILSLHMAEPAGSNHWVITYKMADLATLPPNTLWALIYQLETLPANGDAEHFVAMLTGPDATPHLIHGTTSFPVDGQPVRQFNPAGALEAGSGFNADGTLTLVLDKSKIEGLVPGAPVFSMIPLTHRITPSDGTQPFLYGFRSVGGASLPYDESADGFYEITGNTCDETKSGILGVGALPLMSLGLLLAVVLLRRRV